MAPIFSQILPQMEKYIFLQVLLLCLSSEENSKIMTIVLEIEVSQLSFIFIQKLKLHSLHLNFSGFGQHPPKTMVPFCTSSKSPGPGFP